MTVDIYTALPLEEYLALPAVSRSDLMAMRESPATAQWRKSNPPPASEATIFGTQIHTAILEPDEFASRYILRPNGDARKLAANGGCKEAYETAKASGKEMISEENYRRISDLRCACLRKQSIRGILDAATSTEDTIVWVVESNDGLSGPCKCRPDILGPDFAADLKTTDSLADRDIEAAIFKYGYHIQAAMVQAATKVRSYYLIFLDKNPHHAPDAIVRQLDPAAILQGEVEFLAHLTAWLQCEQSGEWPGRPDELGWIGLPKWAQMEEVIRGAA